MATLASNLHMLRCLEDVRSAFDDRSISLLYLKGAAFLDTLYENPGDRRMCDADILVRKEHLHVAWSVLLDLGYFHRHTAGRAAREASNYEQVFQHTNGMAIGVHVSFCQETRFDVDYGQIWQRATCYRAGGRIVPTLGPEDTVLHLAIHEGKHSFRWTHASDLSRVIETWRPSWEEVVARARQWRMTANLFATLSLAARRGAPVPDWVLHKLRPHPLRTAALTWLVGRGENGFRCPDRLWQFATLAVIIDSPKNFARSVLEWSRLRAYDWLAHRPWAS